MDQPRPASLRVDKWLWYARFFKTRGLAAKQVSGGHVRVNANPIAKASHGVVPGDVLTFAQGRRIRVVEIRGLGTRRGPAPEAQALYTDLSPPPPPPEPRSARPERGAPPSRKERQAAAKLKSFDLE